MCVEEDRGEQNWNIFSVCFIVLRKFEFENPKGDLKIDLYI